MEKNSIMNIRDSNKMKEFVDLYKISQISAIFA